MGLAFSYPFVGLCLSLFLLESKRVPKSIKLVSLLGRQFWECITCKMSTYFGSSGNRSVSKRTCTRALTLAQTRVAPPMTRINLTVFDFAEASDISDSELQSVIPQARGSTTRRPHPRLRTTLRIKLTGHVPGWPREVRYVGGGFRLHFRTPGRRAKHLASLTCAGFSNTCAQNTTSFIRTASFSARPAPSRSALATIQQARCKSTLAA